MVSERSNLMTYLGLGMSLVGVVLYDPLGFLFKGTGLVVIGLGLICMLIGYKQLNEVKIVNKVVKDFERNRRK
ncbi:MAG: hypothetical protein ACJ0FR_02570 [Gammaproteobacteria bacterium]|nr:MAG: hypothetical protein CBD94_00440 [Gammaproteobacteria bacterium TMED234]|tara:strand:- start:159 stop:377 length:219 start_codon:yes stop_codon:yes gene_type:complete